VLAALVVNGASCAGSGGERAPLLVFAAASLGDVFEEAGARYARETGLATRFNFAGSNVLARQIRGGATADVFVSADEAQMRALQVEGLVEGASVGPLLRNGLVVVVREDWPGSLAGLADLAQPAVQRIAIGDPDAVPAGVYARLLLERHGLWQPLRRRMVPTVNVRAALALVDAGHADAAIVYRTDVRSARSARLAFAVPEGAGPDVVYPAAVVARAERPAEARAFLRWLRQPHAAEVFVRHGFAVVPLQP
jgi:molybdate transport system substrate-binding protein